MHTEQDRQAYYRDIEKARQEKLIENWLAENPQVGVLNGGKYYVNTSEGNQIFVKPLTKIQ